MPVNCPCCKNPIIIGDTGTERHHRHHDDNTDDSSSSTSSPSLSTPTKPLFLPCGHYFCGRPECLENISELKDDDSRLKMKIYVITCPMCHNKPYKITVVRSKTLHDYLSEGEEVGMLSKALRTVETISKKSKRHSKCKECDCEYTKYCTVCGDRFCEKCHGEEHKIHGKDDSSAPAGDVIIDIPAAMKKVEEDIDICHKIVFRAAISGESEYDVTEKLYTEYSNGVSYIEKTFDDLIADIKRKKKEVLENTVKMYNGYFSQINDAIELNRRSIGGATAAGIVLDNIKDRRRYKDLFEWKRVAEDFISEYDEKILAKTINKVPYNKQLKLVFTWSNPNPKLENVDTTFISNSFNAFSTVGMFTIKSFSSAQPVKSKREGQFNTIVPSGVQPQGNGPYTAGFRVDVNNQKYTISEDRSSVEASDELRNDGKNYSTIVLGDAPMPPASVVTFAFRVEKLPLSSGLFVGLSTDEFDYERQTNWKKSGWFFHTSSGMLFSCLPQKYAGKVYAEAKRTKVGDVFFGVFDSSKKTLSFKIKYASSEEVVDCGVAYCDIPLSKPVYPAAIMSRGCSISFIK